MFSEAKTGAGSRNPSPQESIVSLLRRKPSHPGFTQGTIQYTDEAINASVQKFKKGIQNSFPNSADFLDSVLPEPDSIHLQASRSNLFIKNGEVFLSYPNGTEGSVNDILRSIYSLNPDLGVFRYAGKLFPARDPKYAHERYPWFNNRLRQVVEIGGMELDDPKIQIMAVGYIAQVAKNMAVEETHELLKHASTFAGFSDVEKGKEAMKNVTDKIYSIKSHQAFIRKSLEAINLTSEKAGLDERNVQLLFDLAFIRNRAFDQPAEFVQALKPLIELMSKNEWDEAYNLRDFLLKYFGASFPEWRRQEYKDELSPNTQSFGSFRELARAVSSHTLILDEEDVPEVYRAVFGAALEKKVERATREREKKLSIDTVDLSLNLVKELAYATRIVRTGRLTKERLSDIFGAKTDEVSRILTDDSRDKYERFDHYNFIIKMANPEVKDDVIEKTFEHFFNKMNTSVEYPENPPYRIYGSGTGRAFDILEIEYYEKSGTQVMWYRTDSSTDYIYDGEKHTARSKRFRNFGRFLYDIMLTGLRPSSYENPVLNFKEIEKALKKAHAGFIEKNPNYSTLTIADYLSSLFSPFERELKLDDVDPVMKFIKSIC